jgi:hypothetical protein
MRVGEVRPSDALRGTVERLYGPIRRVEYERALDDTVAIQALAKVLDRAILETTPASGTLDLRAIAECLVDVMAQNQRQGPDPVPSGRVWGGVLRGQVAAAPGLREHFGARRIARAVENAEAVDALAALIDAGLTETTRGTGKIDPDALAAYLLRAMRAEGT